MRFKQKMVYTGMETNVSKRTGNEYTLVKFLDSGGNYVSCIGEKVDDNIVILDNVEVDFELKVGRYMQLKALEVRKIV